MDCRFLDCGLKDLNRKTPFHNSRVIPALRLRLGQAPAGIQLRMKAYTTKPVSGPWDYIVIGTGMGGVSSASLYR